MKFFKKLFSFSIGSLGAGVIAFISIPFLTRIMNPEEYGSAMLFLSIGMIMSNFSILGLDQAYARYYDKVNFKNLIKNISFLSIISIIVVSLILLLNKELINQYFTKNYNYSFFLIFFIISQNLFRFILVYIRMEQRGYLFSILYIGQRLSELGFILFFISLFTPIHIYLIYSSILGFLVPSIFGLLYLVSSKAVKKENFETKIKKGALLSFGLPLMFSTVLITVLLNIDKIILKMFVINNDLGIYIAALQIALSLNIIQSAFNSFWIPFAYSEFEKDNYKKKFQQINKVLTIIMIILAYVIIYLKEFISLLLGGEYKEANLLIPMLVLMPVFYTLSETVSIGVNLFKKTYLHFRVTLFTLVVHIILLFLLISNLGLVGAAISVGTTFLLLYLLRMYIGQKNLPFIKNTKLILANIIILYSYSLTVTFYDFAELNLFFIVLQLIFLLILAKK